MTDFNKASADKIIKANNIELNSTFIPFSQVHKERKTDFGDKSALNYKVTLRIAGRDVTTFDYTIGRGHIELPAKLEKYSSFMKRQYIEHVCEAPHRPFGFENVRVSKPHVPTPELLDVLYSLLSDTDTRNYSNFEDWAEMLGYDTDSRRAERIYKECLQTALALRNALPHKDMEELVELFQEY